LRVNAPFIVRETHTQAGKPIEQALQEVLESYFHSLSDDRKQLLSHYTITDVARKIVGVGSVGTRCWIIFLSGNSSDDPLFLQVKEAQASVLEPYFYIRQLRDMKGGAEFDPEKVKLQNFSQYCRLCAWSLALAHAKSGDAAMISGYIGNSAELEDAMVRFGFLYADQTEKDFKALAAAARSGRITVAASGT